MGILKEFEDFKDEWKNSSFLFKVLVGISFFMAISSIASLADTIFQWKGFILDGLKFYRKYISIPISYGLKYIGFNYDKEAIDIFILFSIVVIPLIKDRFTYITNRGNVKLKNKATSIIYRALWFDVIFFLSIILILLATVIVLNKSSSVNYSFIKVKYLVIFLFTCLLEVYFKKRIPKIYYPVFVGIIFVLVLGAINSGIAKV
jgi:hypothetical protein